MSHVAMIFQDRSFFSLLLLCSLSATLHRGRYERKLRPVVYGDCVHSWISSSVAPSLWWLAGFGSGLLAFFLTELPALGSSDTSDTPVIAGFDFHDGRLFIGGVVGLSLDFIRIMLDLRFLDLHRSIDFRCWHAIVSSSLLWGPWHLQVSSFLQSCPGFLLGESMFEGWFVFNWSFIEAKIFLFSKVVRWFFLMRHPVLVCSGGLPVSCSCDVFHAVKFGGVSFIGHVSPTLSEWHVGCSSWLTSSSWVSFVLGERLG